MCNTARRSVRLIFSPANIAMHARSPASSTSASSSRIVSSVMRCFE
jgi:hypothetical protein